MLVHRDPESRWMTLQGTQWCQIISSWDHVHIIWFNLTYGLNTFPINVGLTKLLRIWVGFGDVVAKIIFQNHLGCSAIKMRITISFSLWCRMWFFNRWIPIWGYDVFKEGTDLAQHGVIIKVHHHTHRLRDGCSTRWCDLKRATDSNVLQGIQHWNMTRNLNSNACLASLTHLKNHIHPQTPIPNSKILFFGRDMPVPDPNWHPQGESSSSLMENHLQRMGFGRRGWFTKFRIWDPVSRTGARINKIQVCIRLPKPRWIQQGLVVIGCTL